MKVRFRCDGCNNVIIKARFLRENEHSDIRDESILRIRGEKGVEHSP